MSTATLYAELDPGTSLPQSQLMSLLIDTALVTRLGHIPPSASPLSVTVHPVLYRVCLGLVYRRQYSIRASRGSLRTKLRRWATRLRGRGSCQLRRRLPSTTGDGPCRQCLDLDSSRDRHCHRHRHSRDGVPSVLPSPEQRCGATACRRLHRCPAQQRHTAHHRRPQQTASSRILAWLTTRTPLQLPLDPQPRSTVRVPELRCRWHWPRQQTAAKVQRHFPNHVYHRPTTSHWPSGSDGTAMRHRVSPIEALQDLQSAAA